jgi:predicted acyltransferase
MNVSRRLLSLDFMRGLIMVLLTIESTHLYEHLAKATQGSFVNGFFQQFFHHPWHGLKFWDLVQPGFMFIAGVAMAYSLGRQKKEGVSWARRFRKTLKRCGWLFFWGVLDYAVRPAGLSFELWDVLTQLSFTTLITFLVFDWSAAASIAFAAGILLFTECIYRFSNIPGFNQPFTNQHNFGNYVDMLLMNKINAGGWVAINCIPTTVHTLLGAVTGKLLMSDDTRKLQKLVAGGIAALLLGYGLDWMGITPVIKRIATSSFVLVSLGWCLLALALFYWWIDVKGHRRRLNFFLVFAMNSIFIYLFFEIVGHQWFNKFIETISMGLLHFVHIPELLKLVITSLCIFVLEWQMCYFLYRKNIFFKL